MCQPVTIQLGSPTSWGQIRPAPRGQIEPSNSILNTQPRRSPHWQSPDHAYAAHSAR